MRFICALVFYLTCLAQQVVAHEFWIEPETYLIEPGQSVKANLRIGQNFGGSRVPYLTRRFQTFQILDSDGQRDLEGTEGDVPAISITPSEGLAVLAYHSVPDTLTFREFEKFESYVLYEGLDWAVAAHRDAGLPDAGFTEQYTRNAKALIQVGEPGVGADRALGLPFEIVVDGSPYAPGLTEVPVTLLRLGAPAPDWQINIFTRPRGEAVVLTNVTTDADGRAVVPFPEDADVMLNAVWLQFAKDKPEVDYESWWASTSFGRVGRSE